MTSFEEEEKHGIRDVHIDKEIKETEMDLDPGETPSSIPPGFNRTQRLCPVTFNSILQPVN